MASHPSKGRIRSPQRLRTLTHVAPPFAMSSAVSASQEIAKATSKIIFATKSALPHSDGHHSPLPGR